VGATHGIKLAEARRHRHHLPISGRCRTGGNARPDSFQETRLLEVIAAQRTEVIAGLPLPAVWSGYGW
jgi:hypothetical protein